MSIYIYTYVCIYTYMSTYTHFTLSPFAPRWCLTMLFQSRGSASFSWIHLACSAATLAALASCSTFWISSARCCAGERDTTSFGAPRVRASDRPGRRLKSKRSTSSGRSTEMSFPAADAGLTASRDSERLSGSLSDVSILSRGRLTKNTARMEKKRIRLFGDSSRSRWNVFFQLWKSHVTKVC